MLGVEAACVGEASRRSPPGRVGDAGEEAGAAPRDGEVGDVADVAVERPRRLARARRAPPRRWVRQLDAGEGADHPEGREVDADRLEPRAADRLDEGGDHVAAGGDDDDVDLRRRALLGGDAADHLMLEHRLVERHRDLLLGLEADRRLELLGVLDRRQAQRADDDPLVADAEPHPLGELVLGEERLQRLGEGVGVGDLALVEGARRRAGSIAAGDHLRRAVDRDLGRGDAAGLDVETDDGAGLLAWSVA